MALLLLSLGLLLAWEGGQALVPPNELKREWGLRGGYGGGGEHSILARAALGRQDAGPAGLGGGPALHLGGEQAGRKWAGWDLAGAGWGAQSIILEVGTQSVISGWLDGGGAEHHR